ncbi:AbrB/MazE/SpoVT family DNA-binding domain-containing protein [Enterococcus ureasiticus]|uniref:SpoVT-AbrB domain-containing protein n=1 Tax=Enterococcus ureasiticus TaxID=903984 RepID=A0A1E5GP21_9ENTE|nr:AbrB/MazE/SpoVT family DNA-binding domain-containing protein [Enterococcus ureasiticus]OEG14325.1 hypothetical protein BCR21_04870 [Enterococcus ureasiticus]
MTETIRKSKQIRKNGSIYITSLPKEVIQVLSLNEGDRLDFIIRDGQVTLEKSLAIKLENVPNRLSDDIDFFMNKYDQVFKKLVEK